MAGFLLSEMRYEGVLRICVLSPGSGLGYPKKLCDKMLGYVFEKNNIASRVFGRVSDVRIRCVYYETRESVKMVSVQEWRGEMVVDGKKVTKIASIGVWGGFECM